MNVQQGSHTTLRGGWLIAARAGWIAITLLSVGMFLAALPIDFQELQRICTGADCKVDVQLMADDAQALEDMGVSRGVYAGYFALIEILLLLVFAIISTVIFWRRSDDWMAMFVSLALLTYGTSLPGITRLLVEEQPTLVVLVDLLEHLAYTSLPVLFFLFPDGRFVPRWTRFVVLAVILVGLVDLVAFGGWQTGEDQFAEGIMFLTLLAVPIGVFAQIYRYRRVSDSVHRQQIKWVVFALIALVMASLVGAIVEDALGDPGRPRLLFNLIGIPLFFAVPTMMVPVAIGVSILRYRLWEIDVLINRALVYGVLTVTIGGAYIASVVVLQAAFRTVTGADSTLVIVASTLTIAALFQPLRRRVQAIIDRRFYRRRYSAAQTLASFSAIARDELDLERLSDALLRAVDETMQPAHMSLSLRNTEGDMRERFS